MIFSIISTITLAVMNHLSIIRTVCVCVRAGVRACLCIQVNALTFSVFVCQIYLLWAYSATSTFHTLPCFLVGARIVVIQITRHKGTFCGEHTRRQDIAAPQINNRYGTLSHWCLILCGSLVARLHWVIHEANRTVKTRCVYIHDGGLSENDMSKEPIQS